jgi:hypothetical protein
MNRFAVLKARIAYNKKLYYSSIKEDKEDLPFLDYVAGIIEKSSSHICMLVT